MKKFKFPLENVLKVRALHKKMAERQVALTKNKIQKCDESLAENRRAFDESFEFLNGKGENMAFWHEITSRYQQGLKNREQDLLEQKETLDHQLKNETKLLSKRMKDEKVIENLKEHAKAEHFREAELAEQKELEELDLLKRGKS